MNDQVILSVTKRGGGLEVTTRGTGHDQLAAIEAVAASAAAEWRRLQPFYVLTVEALKNERDRAARRGGVKETGANSEGT